VRDEYPAPKPATSAAPLPKAIVMISGKRGPVQDFRMHREPLLQEKFARLIAVELRKSGAFSTVALVEDRLDESATPVPMTGLRKQGYQIVFLTRVNRYHFRLQRMGFARPFPFNLVFSTIGILGLPIIPQQVSLVYDVEVRVISTGSGMSMGKERLAHTEKSVKMANVYNEKSKAQKTAAGYLVHIYVDAKRMAQKMAKDSERWTRDFNLVEESGNALAQ
jgi:hypothetical protein